MPAANEIELPRPLDALEIKDGITYKIATAVREKLDKSCRLFGKSYPKFRAKVSIHIELDDFGMTTEDNHTVVVEDGPLEEKTYMEEIALDIEEVPPNVFRRETEQAIPTLVSNNGKQEEKRITYAQKRGPGRPRKQAD